VPYLKVQTNRPPAPEQAAEFARRASREVAEALGKSENYVMVALEPAPLAMVFAGNDEPAAYLELKSIGLPEDRTAGLSERLCNLVEEALGVPAGRTYIEFADAARHLWGWNRRTF